MANIGFDVDLGTQQMARAEVLHADPEDWTVLVRRDDDHEILRCDLLQTTSIAPLLPCRGDRVIVVSLPGGEQRGVILGRIGVGATVPTVEAAMTQTPRVEKQETPEEIILEATHSITLRVGDGSITIRDDGKILIKGKDLVSHAQRVNRIKGGSVSIN